MVKQEFQDLWKSKFPKAYPIGHELKWVYKDRWFRIHSLPESKRYAETEEEYQIIYQRQNELIADLTSEKETIILLFGEYAADKSEAHGEVTNEWGKFETVDLLELHKLRPEAHEEAYYLKLYAREINWIPNQWNHLLKAIADDQMRMMLIVPNKNRIIVPYDGGMDLILESETIRDHYKTKYHKWLSKHPEGL